MLKSLLRLSVALLLPAAFASGARANERTTVPGTNCMPSMPVDPTEPGTFYDYTFEGGFSVRTAANSPIRGYDFMCPLTRRLPLSTAGLSDLELRFRANGNYRDGQTRWASCDAISLRSDGSILVYKSKGIDVQPMVHDNTTGLDNSPMAVMDFNDVVNASSSKGTYTLRCGMPSGVTLVSVYHSEEDGISGN